MMFVTHIHWLSFLVYSLFAAAVIKNNPRSLLNYVAAASFCCFSLWSFSFIFVHNPFTPRETAVVFLNISTVGGLFYPVFVLWLVLLFDRKGNRRALAVVVILFFITPLYLTVLQFQTHGIWDISQLSRAPYGWKIHFTGSNTYKAYAVYSTLTISAVLGLLLKQTLDKSKSDLHRKQALIMLLGTVAVFALNYLIERIQIFYGLSSSTLNDMGFLGWAVAIYIGITRFQLFSPSLRHAPEVILAIISEAVLLTNRENRVTYANAAALDLYGDRNLVTDRKTISDLIQFTQPDSETPLPADNKPFINNPAEFRNRDGRRTQVLVSCTPLVNVTKNIYGSVFVIRDVTEYLMMRRELEKSQRFESLSVFAGGVAHDLNNILGGVVGYLDLALMNTPPEGKTSSFLNKAASAIPSLMGLTKQLLSFSKGGIPELKSCRLCDVVINAAELALSGSSIKLETDLDSSLPPIMIDAGQIVQVVNNIVVNARQAMEDRGKVTLRIVETTLAPDNTLDLNPGPYIQVFLTNTGPPIPEGTLAHIFDPFYTTKEQGSGIGLSTSRKIVEKHSGRLDCLSSTEQGTTFRIILPIESQSPYMADSDGEPRTLVPGGTILVVDDEESIRQVASEMLNHLGISSLQAADGETALKLVEESLTNSSPLRAVLLDMTLKGEESGWELAEKIHLLIPALPLILSSGYDMEEAPGKTGLGSFSALLSKPYTLEDLIKVLLDLPG